MQRAVAPQTATVNFMGPLCQKVQILSWSQIEKTPCDIHCSRSQTGSGIPRRSGDLDSGSFWWIDMYALSLLNLCAS